ncbi:MAG: F0F1 ATP synthase subunit A [Planctomycetes bacterium]|nr:F0F1 ATP synthase subunit A [Planctomycetota bacterium]
MSEAAKSSAEQAGHEAADGAHEAPAGHEAHGAGEGHGKVKEFDASHHILDHVVMGLSTDGKIVPHPYHHGVAVAGYEPRMVGPFKLEFTRYMQDLTVVAVLLFVVIMAVTRKVLVAVKSDEAPKGKLANAVEALIVFVRDELVKPIGGKHLVPYTPLFLTYFFVILACNFSGMVPWFFHGATASISVTGALGGSVFVLILILGMYKQGVVSFWVHLVPHGVPWWLWPVLFVLELIGPMIKCFVLCVRLFANMIAGHLIIGNVLKLGIFGAAGAGAAVTGLAIGIPLALGVSILEILVCFLQAYVFTMLAVVFIGAAVHPEH